MVRLFFLLAATLSLMAQQPSGEPAASDAVIRVSVHQVLVPVVVTDKKGHHVTGLHASDFRLFEDGVPQEIAAFSTGAAATVHDVGALSKPASEPAAPAPSPAGPRRTFVICIDTLHALPPDIARLRDTLENLFREEKGTDAQYVVIAIGRHLQVLQTATSNPSAIAAKIRTPGFLEALGGRDAAAFSTALRTVNNRMEEFCRRCACGARSRNCDTAIDTLKQSVDAEAAQWTPLFNEMAAEFKSVVAELAKLPTSRTLLLVSGGFSLNPKREFYAAVAASLPASPQFSAGSIKEPEPILDEALKIAADRNVTIYGVDSRGASASPLAGSATMDASTGSGGQTQSVIQSRSVSVRTTSLDTPGHTASALPPAGITMQQLANATGGVYFHDSKDLLKQFRSAMADGREYYVLAYIPKLAYVPMNGKAAEGTFRKITVEVAGKNLNTRSKAGYWADASVQ